jgi:hypothetical protein
MAFHGYGNNDDEIPQIVYAFIIELLRRQARISVERIMWLVLERFGYTMTREQVIQIMEDARSMELI